VHKTEFISELLELQDIFGYKLNDKQSNILWDSVGVILLGEFKQAVNQLAETCTRGPTIAQIKLACLPAIRKAREANIRRITDDLKNSTRKCDYCDNTGTVLAKLRSNKNISYAFSCSECNHPNKPQYPKWRSEYINKYQPLTSRAPFFKDPTMPVFKNKQEAVNYALSLIGKDVKKP